MRKTNVKMHIFFGIALLFLYLCLYYVDTSHQFNKLQSHWGFSNFIPLGELFDPSRGFILKNALVVEVEVTCSIDDEDTSDSALVVEVSRYFYILYAPK
jgi:hypothetical protein